MSGVSQLSHLTGSARGGGFFGFGSSISITSLASFLNVFGGCLEEEELSSWSVSFFPSVPGGTMTAVSFVEGMWTRALRDLDRFGAILRSSVGFIGGCVIVVREN